MAAVPYTRGFLGEWICGLLSSRGAHDGKFETTLLEELPHGCWLCRPKSYRVKGERSIRSHLQVPWVGVFSLLLAPCRFCMSMSMWFAPGIIKDLPWNNWEVSQVHINKSVKKVWGRGEGWKDLYKHKVLVILFVLKNVTALNVKNNNKRIY